MTSTQRSSRGARKPPRWSDLAGAAVTMFFVAIMVLQFLTLRGLATEIAYSDFQQLVTARLVTDLEITPTRISGALKMPGATSLLPASDALAVNNDGEPWRFTTVRVADDRLADTLAAAGIRYSGGFDSAWPGMLLSWALPLLMLFAAWNLLSRRSGGLQQYTKIGRGNAHILVQNETGISFDDIAGIDEAKAELRQIVAFLQDAERYRRLGGKIPKGVLIVGAPGTGKTLLAKAVAGEAGVPFYSVSGAAFVEMFVGVGAARVRDLFEQAQAEAPCIVFIDELDALGKVRGVGLTSGNDEREQTLNQLLIEMDGFKSNSGVIIMAATNRPETLDPALLRPGRFDRHIAIDRPDLNGRRQILAVHTRHVKLAADIDLNELASRTPGFVGADLANVVNEAALHAAEADKQAVDMADFDEAIDRAMTGMERKSRVMNAQEKTTIAYHEAGHALVAQFRAHCDPVKKVSIIPRGVAALGYTQQVPTEDRYLLRESELLDRLDALLGGRVAEELVFGDVSTGAENDLDRATAIARHMVTRYGMSRRTGLLTIGDSTDQPSMSGLDRWRGSLCSDDTARLIDEETRRLLDDAHARVTATLSGRRATLERIAGLLLEREVLDRDMLRKVIDDANCALTPPAGEGAGAQIEAGQHDETSCEG
ncbi:ATP-dependent zinc metalloprotease FtsH [Paraburkholderia bengalensis]|uniref:ATP-dependent zinc metalloprotease FtsH n=1 Tax=Paraburkholderia bengalensis TaxID=2747562 RepID=A0ABU8J644_9BURK